MQGWWSSGKAVDGNHAFWVHKHGHLHGYACYALHSSLRRIIFGRRNRGWRGNERCGRLEKTSIKHQTQNRLVKRNGYNGAFGKYERKNVAHTGESDCDAIIQRGRKRKENECVVRQFVSQTTVLFLDIGCRVIQKIPFFKHVRLCFVKFEILASFFIHIVCF